MINSSYKPEKFCELGKAVIQTELEAIQKLLPRIDANFAAACSYLLHCEGRIVVTGMGKSGHIARKIASTLASTGSPAIFVHPGEAGHGDSGMITRQDVSIIISYSGETQEIVTLLPFIKRLGIPLISITGNPTSSLAKISHICLNAQVDQEACPLGLAPTASTTTALVIGDALAIALLQARGFTEKDFALSHPGGALGRRLLLHVDDVMRVGDAIPIVPSQTILSDALVEMTQKSLGCTLVLNTEGIIVGIFTDGDLRRALDKNINLHKTIIDKVMTSQYKTISLGILAAEALQILEHYKITVLPIVDKNNKPLGIIHLHDLLRAGVV